MEDPGVKSGVATKEQLMHYFREMYTIRRMEIACDTEYKVRVYRARSRWAARAPSSRQLNACSLCARPATLQARKIRGFCHLYDGQEAIAAGLQASLTKDDNLISSYRCHALQYIRGDTVKRIVGELFGFELVRERARAAVGRRFGDPALRPPGDGIARLLLRFRASLRAGLREGQGRLHALLQQEEPVLGRLRHRRRAGARGAVVE
jgi:hypothetical protein